MKRWLALLALIGASLPPGTRADEIAEVNGRMTSRQMCDNLQQISLRKVRQTGPVRDASALHDRLQQRLPSPPQKAATILRVLASGGMSANGPAGLESVIAWRQDDGRWFAQRAEEISSHRDDGPQTPLAPIWPDPNPKSSLRGHLAEPGNLSYASGPLSQAEGETLDRALHADSCIAVEPPSLPTSLPLRRGGVASCIPDSAGRHIEIRRGNIVQLYARPCYSIGPIGMIGMLLDNAALPPAPNYRNREDLYHGTHNPDVSSLRAFLTARLPEMKLRDAQGEQAITKVRQSAPCEMTLSLASGPGARRETNLSFLGPRRGYGRWVERGEVPLGSDMTDPTLIAADTILALQVQGALFHLAQLCRT